MDPEQIKQWMAAAARAIAALKAAKDLLPAGKKRDEAERLIHEAESALKRSDAKLASDLGSTLCSRCWPPEIMLRGADNVLRCRCCGLEPSPQNLSSVNPNEIPRMRWH